MTVIDIAAKELQMKPGELLKESLKTYLEKRLSKVEADIFLLTKKYGVKDVFECIFRVNPATHSKGKRPLIPKYSGH